MVFLQTTLHLGATIAAFLGIAVLGVLIIARRWGIGSRLAFILLAFVPFLISLGGAVHEIDSLHRYEVKADTPPIEARQGLSTVADIVVLIPTGAILSILLLLLSFATFLQIRKSQSASILPDPAANRS